MQNRFDNQRSVGQTLAEYFYLLFLAAVIRITRSEVSATLVPGPVGYEKKTAPSTT